MKYLSSLSLSLLLVTGCASGIKDLGKVGDTRFYQVKARSFCGPNITIVATQRDGQRTPTIEASAGGSGIGPSLISAAGNVGTAAAFGLSLRPDQTRVSQTGGNSTSDSSSDSTSSSAASASGTGQTSVQTTTTRVNGNSANAPGHNKP